jgi:hypothetical protein
MLDAEAIESEIMQILVAGEADSAAEAQRRFLERHIDDVARLALEPLSDEEFRRHPLIVLLMMHGSRSREDSLR